MSLKMHPILFIAHYSFSDLDNHTLASTKLLNRGIFIYI